MENSYNNLIEQLENLIDNAKVIPFTGMASIEKNEVFDLIKKFRLNVPAEITQAQRIVAKGDKFINDANMKAASIIRDAEATADKLTMDKEIVRRAQETADAILADANAQANDIVSAAQEKAESMRIGSLNYADEILDNTSKSIQAFFDNLGKRTSDVQDYLSNEIDAIYAERQELSNLKNSGN